MKQISSFKLQKLGIYAFLSALLAAQFFALKVNAAAGQFILTPGYSNSNLTVTIEIIPGESIDGVEAKVSYDASALELRSVDSRDSAFPLDLREKNGSGIVQIDRGILGKRVSSRGLVSKIIFSAKAGSGETTVKVSGNATSNGKYTNPSGASVDVSLGSDSVSNPTSRENNNPAVIDVLGVDAQFNTAKIAVSSGKASKFHILIGTDENNLNITAKPKAAEYEVELDESVLSPGVTYYYKVVGVNSNGKRLESEVESFTTKGYQVELELTDNDGNALANKEVTLYSEPKTAMTDSNGVAVFSDVSPGEHRVEYIENGQTYSESVNVENAPIKTGQDGTQFAEKQRFSVTYKNLSSGTQLNVLTVSLLALLAAFVFGAACIYYVKKQKNTSVSETENTREQSSLKEADYQERPLKKPLSSKSTKSQDEAAKVSENDKNDAPK